MKINIKIKDFTKLKLRAYFKIMNYIEFIRNILNCTQ